MPAGVSWGQYIGFTVSALVSMGVGAQIVHRFYQPLSDLDEYVEREYQRIRTVQGASSATKEGKSML